MYKSHDRYVRTSQDEINRSYNASYLGKNRHVKHSVSFFFDVCEIYYKNKNIIYWLFFFFTK